MIEREAYKFVKAELESREDDPVIRPHIREAVKKLIKDRYEKEVQRISEDALAESFNKILFSAFGLSGETSQEENKKGGICKISLRV